MTLVRNLRWMMHQTHLLRRVLLAPLVVALMAPHTASAQSDPGPAMDELAAAGLSPEAIAQEEPNSSWDGLAMFSEDSTRLLAALSEGLTPETYAFGDSKQTPPIINPTGALPIAGGRALFTIPDGWTAPADGIDQSMAFAQNAGTTLAPGDEVLFLWTEFDSDYDFNATDLTINEGFPITIPGLPVWNSTFAGDTWEGANLIPNAVYDGSSLTFDIKSYQPPQSFPLVSLPAFYYRSGNVMAIALDAEALTEYVAAATTGQASATNEGTSNNLLYTGGAVDTPTQIKFDWSRILTVFYTHEAVGELFTPGFIAIAVMMAFIASFATVDLQTLRLPELNTDEAPTSTSSSTSTSTSTSTTTPPPPEKPAEPTDGGGSAPLLPFGLGIGLLALIGGLIFAVRKKKPKENCADEKAHWDAEEKLYQDAVDAITPAEQTLDDAIEARKKAVQELAKARAEVPPDGTDSVTDENTGETITSLDRWLRDRFANDEYNAYRNNPTPETARAYEEAMRQADTPEAREARREAGKKAKEAAEKAAAAFKRAQDAERKAEAALQRRHRDVGSEREMADAAKKAYEDCIKEQAEFDRKSADAKKRYEEAVERERKKRKREAGGDPGGVPGGGPAALTPPPVATGSPCSPLGGTKTGSDKLKRKAIDDNDTVTITISRLNGYWDSGELKEDSGDAFLNQFGAGSGAGTRTATFKLTSKAASDINPDTIVSSFLGRKQWVEDDWSATATPSVEMTVAWNFSEIEATCSAKYRCTPNGWQSTGPGKFSRIPTRSQEYSEVFSIGDQDPSNQLRITWRTLKDHIDGRDALFKFQEQCELRK